jgi:hypothetical protein
VLSDEEQLKKTCRLASTSIYNAIGKKYQVVVKTTFDCKYQVWLANQPWSHTQGTQMLN